MKEIRSRHLLLIILICILITSSIACKNEVSYTNFENHIKSDNYKLKDVQNPTKNISVSVKYIPSKLIAAREFYNLNKELQGENLEKYSKYLYFNLSISKDNQDLLAIKGRKYDELVNNICYNLSQFITLKTEKNEEIKLITFHTPRTYGLSNATDVLLVFNRSDLQNNKEVFMILNKDIKLLNKDLEFKFKIEEINKIEQKNIVL